MKAYRSRVVRGPSSGSVVLPWLVLLCLGVLVQGWLTRYRLHQLPQKNEWAFSSFSFVEPTSGRKMRPVAFLSRLAKTKPAWSPDASVSAEVERLARAVELAQRTGKN